MSTTQEDVRSRGRQIRAKTCIHWQGALGPRPCALGVDLAPAGPRVQLGWAYRIPCCGSVQAAFVCDRKETRTEAELDAEHKALMDAADKLVAVVALIPRDKSVRSGEATCPRCSGTLDWSRSDYNDHLRVACRTPDCLKMME